MADTLKSEEQYNKDHACPEKQMQHTKEKLTRRQQSFFLQA